MSAPLTAMQLFGNIRRSELMNSSPNQLKNDIEFIQFVQSLIEAQSDLFDEEPEKQKRAIIVLNSISDKFGFGKDTLDSTYFIRIKELIFESESFEVVKYSLQLVESLIERSPWTIPSFLKLDFPKKIYQKMQLDDITVPLCKFSFVLNSLLCNSSQAYSILTEDKPAYLDYLIKKANEDISKTDATWVLGSIQSVTASPYFQENESLHDIVHIAIKYFEKNDSDIMSLVFTLFGRCLSGSQYLSPQEISDITTPEIVQRAYYLIETKDMSNIRSVFNYIDNYICVNNENTMNFISMGFVQLFYQIFKICDNEYQIQAEILGILKNAAVEPFESTIEILRSPIVMECIPVILEMGRLSLKRGAVYLLSTLINKVGLFSTPDIIIDQESGEKVNPSNLILILIQKLFYVIPDLLSCEDDDITLHCLYILQHIITEIQTLKQDQAMSIIDLISLELKEELFNMLKCKNESFQGLSVNIIKSLDNYMSNFTEETV